MFVLDLLRFIVGIIILSIGAYTDLKYREASNKLWVILGTVAGIILVIDFYQNGINPLKIFLMIFMIILAYVLFQLHVIGGADAKAIMCLSILIPFFVFDVLFISCIVSLLFVPVIVLFKRISFKEVMVGYSFPFLVSILLGFILSFILSGFWSFSLLYRFVLFFS